MFLFPTVVLLYFVVLQVPTPYPRQQRYSPYRHQLVFCLVYFYYLVVTYNMMSLAFYSNGKRQRSAIVCNVFLKVRVCDGSNLPVYRYRSSLIRSWWMKKCAKSPRRALLLLLLRSRTSRAKRSKTTRDIV